MADGVVGKAVQSKGERCLKTVDRQVQSRASTREKNAAFRRAKNMPHPRIPATPDRHCRCFLPTIWTTALNLWLVTHILSFFPTGAIRPCLARHGTRNWAA